VVPLAPGGSIDALARNLARTLETVVGQPIIVENRSGANGQIAMEYVSSQPGDGYTLLFPTVSFAAIEVTNPNYKADVLKKFAPVALVERRPNVIFSSSKAPFKTFAEMIEFGQKNPGQLNSAVNGSIGILTATWIHQAAGIKAEIVRFKGQGEIVTSLVRGDVHYNQTFPETMMQYVEKGDMRVIATLGSSRAAQFPDVPTVSEILPGVVLNSWTGLIAPAGTPVEVVTRLNQATREALAKPELETILDRLGSVPGDLDPEQFREVIANDRAAFKKLALDAKLAFE
jgi:tripartite-type tricarboxylate transporter receptor subunit TctC